MATFDLNTFAKLTGKRDLFSSVGMSFGMPSCLLNLTQDVLKLLPSPILAELSNISQGARNKADELTKEVFSKLLLDTGIIEFDTEEGIFKFVSNSSKFGLDKNQGGVLGQIGGFLGALQAAASFGGRLYRNYETGKAQIEGLVNCFKGYNEVSKFQSGNSADRKLELARKDPAAFEELFNSRYAAEKRNLEGALEFIDKVNSNLDIIDGIFLDRALDPSLEPEFTGDYDTIVSGLGFRLGSEEDKKKKEDKPEVIRLVYAPPKSKTGQFLLSQDGLYYDSQTDGLVPVLAEISSRESRLKPSEKWTFEHDPNLGGRGQSISINNIVEYVDTIFDPNIEDNTPKLNVFYTADHFLNVLIGNKEKRILDLSAHVTALEAAGESTAIIENTRQSLLSEIALFDSKIKRRRKQIELAVKLPSILGGKGGQFKPGEIPVNDFSYLQEFHFSFDINKQKALVLNQEDISGVVLPLDPVFVTNPGNENYTTIEHLFIPQIGVGDIILSDYSALGQVGTQQSITDTIVTDGLLAVYNFLNSEVKTPSSTEFQVISCNHENPIYRAQLVGSHPSSIFYSGLGIPYFEGITRNNGSNVTGLGSYAKLPDIPDFQDFTYGDKGFSVEAWIHTPGLNDYVTWQQNESASSVFRIMLGCENTGIASGITPQADILRLNGEQGNNFNRGLLMGFTSDRRLTLGQPPSNESELNRPASSLCFFMAPTQSYDQSSVGFINWPQGGGCASANSWRALTVSAGTAGPAGAKFIHACREFMHLVVSVDVRNNQIKVYLDKNLMATSSVTDVFGITKFTPINLPNFRKDNSFEYSSTTLNSDAPNALKLGPRLNKFFTPWIVGGGYTDGMTLTGNFMGGTYGGIVSGFRGHIGSLKFYTKPLDSGEVNVNYNAQQAFFKNIQTAQTCWDELEL